MKYIGTEDVTVTCVYGTFNIRKDVEVPLLIAKKFKHYITEVEEIMVEELPTETVEENIETPTKTKKGNN